MTEPHEDLTDPSALAEPIISEGRRHRFSIVWFIPIVAALVGLWLAYHAISQVGPTVTITFDSARGLEAGKTKIRYKDVQVGEVDAIGFSDDLSKVIVTATLIKGTDPYLTDKSRFWVVRARIGLGEISGLGTILSGAYIAMDPVKDGQPISDFVGLDKPPVVTTGQPGRHFVLHSPSLGSARVGAKLYFRGISVGRVVENGLDPDGESVRIRVFVRSPHDARVHTNTRFWKAGGLQVSLDDRGMRMGMHSLAALLAGGIAFDTPPEVSPTQPAPEGAVFWLHKREGDIEEPSFEHKRTYLLRFTGSARGLSRDASVELRGFKIGRVAHLGLEFDKQSLEFSTSVLVDIERERLLALGGDVPTQHKGRPMIESLVERGLRAKLRVGSLLTRRLYVDLDFHPDAPSAKVTYHGKLIEVPTLPSDGDSIGRMVAGLAQKLGDIPFDKIGKQLQSTVAGVNRMVNSDDLKDTVRSLNRALKQVGPMVTKLNSTVAPALAASLRHLQNTLASVEGLVGPTAPFRNELQQAVGELGKAARSLRTLVDYLERHPEALLKGKGGN